MMKLDRTKAPEIKAIEHFSIQNPECTTMRNGMKLNIINAGNEDVVRFDLLIGGGQWDQSRPLQAVFTNRMLREGTRSFTSRQIAERLDYYGAWLDLSSSVNHGFVTLYSLSKYFARTAEILASMVKEPLFPEQELSVVVEGNKQQYLVNAKRVDVMARKEFNRALFGTTHPLGRFAELKDYETITSDDLKAFHNTYYSSCNCTAYVSGRVTPEIIRIIERNFGDGAWGNPEKQPLKQKFDINTTADKYIFLEKDDALQSSLKMGSFSLDRKHPDYQKVRVMVTLLGGYFGSRLMSNIREDKGYTYGIGAGVLNYPELGVFGISTEADNCYIPSIITEVNKEIEILQNEIVDDEELNMVRNYMLGDLCRTYESAFSLSDAWIFIETSGLDAGHFERTVDAIKGVTADEIMTMAQKYLNRDDLITVVAGKKV